MKKALLYIQSIFYMVAGANHFRSPHTYEAIIPPFIPAHSILNILAGIAEILLGYMLIFVSTRKIAAYGIVLMLLAFLPVHIYHIQMHGCLPPLCFREWVAWLRLLVFQPVLIGWAWWQRK